MKILITGRPGIGKTTAVLRIVQLCKSAGVNVGGMVTKEVREAGKRIGFKVIDIASEREGWLASIFFTTGPRIGKYRVNLNDLEEIGVKAILHALENCELVVVDEIGPMELFSEAFKAAVAKCFEEEVNLVATIHIKANKFEYTRMLINKFKPKIITLNYYNRDSVPREVVSELLKSIKK